MTAIPLSPIAQAAVDALGDSASQSIDVAALLAAITAQDANRGTGLIDKLGLTVPGAPRIDRDVLLDRAGEEALRLGAPRTGPEHVVLGVVAVLGGDVLDGVDVVTARADLQALIADTAGRAYEVLEPVAPRPVRPPFALVLAGLPGTGKSTLAERLAGELRAPVFSLDWQLGALTPFGLVRGDNAVPLADHVLTAAMARQLQLGLGVVLDTSGHRRETRQRWRTVAGNLGARFVGVECVCSDEQVHRGRVDGRSRGIPGWPGTVSWDHVNRMRAKWEPWDEPHLVLDTVEPIDVCVRRLVDATLDTN